MTKCKRCKKSKSKKRVYCSKECFYKSLLNHKRFKKMPLCDITCVWCKKTVKVKHYKRKKLCCSKKCGGYYIANLYNPHNKKINREKHFMNAAKEENNSRWKGGVNQSYYIRKSIEIDGVHCTVCRTEKKVHTHHIDRDRLNNPKNGENWLRLCREHHQQLHCMEDESS